MADLNEINKLRDEQTQRAKSFRSNMSGMQKEYEATQKNRARTEIGQAMRNVGANYNQRGLLFSGLRRAGEVGAAQDVASQGAASQAAFNQQLEGQAQGLESQAIGTGLSAQNLAQQREDMAFQNALADREARQGAIRGLGGALGSITGSIFGRR